MELLLKLMAAKIIATVFIVLQVFYLVNRPSVAPPTLHLSR